MKTFIIAAVPAIEVFWPDGGGRITRFADEWKIQDGFVMFYNFESSDPIFAIRADMVFSIEVQDDS